MFNDLWTISTDGSIIHLKLNLVIDGTYNTTFSYLYKL